MKSPVFSSFVLKQELQWAITKSKLRPLSPWSLHQRNIHIKLYRLLFISFPTIFLPQRVNVIFLCLAPSQKKKKKVLILVEDAIKCRILSHFFEIYLFFPCMYEKHTLITSACAPLVNLPFWLLVIGHYAT